MLSSSTLIGCLYHVLDAGSGRGSESPAHMRHPDRTVGTPVTVSGLRAIRNIRPGQLTFLTRSEIGLTADRFRRDILRPLFSASRIANPNERPRTPSRASPSDSYREIVDTPEPYSPTVEIVRPWHVNPPAPGLPSLKSQVMPQVCDVAGQYFFSSRMLNRNI
jgi:hypothetical protein